MFHRVALMICSTATVNQPLSECLPALVKYQISRRFNCRMEAIYMEAGVLSLELKLLRRTCAELWRKGWNSLTIVAW